LPDFIPGKVNGEKVSVQYKLPIIFKLSDSPQTKSIDKENMPILILDGKVLPKEFDTKSLNKDSILSVVVFKADTEKKRDILIAKYGDKAKNGIIVITSKKHNSPTQTQQNTESSDKMIYTVVEMMPLFPGGEQKLKEFINNHLNYPETAKGKGIQGRVIVRFVVNSTGIVEKAEVLRSLDPEYDKEALRVVNSLPAFIPAKQNGENVSVYYTLSISFKLK